MKKLLIAVLVLGTFGSAAFAAGEWKKDASLNLGYASAMGDWGDEVKSGIGFGLDYDGYKINDDFSVGAGFFYTGGDIKGQTTTSYSMTVWGLTPFIKYAKEVDLGGKKATAYGTLGLGFYGVSDDVPSPLDFSETDFGFNIGGGLMFPLADKMQLGGELKYHSISTSFKDAAGSSINASYFVPSVKFTYSF